MHYFRLQSLLQSIYEKDEKPGKIIIFIETKRRVESISRYIRGFGVKCGTLHGDKSQNERDFVLREFRSDKSNILVATDVAARGLGKLKYFEFGKMGKCVSAPCGKWQKVVWRARRRVSKPLPPPLAQPDTEGRRGWFVRLCSFRISKRERDLRLDIIFTRFLFSFARAEHILCSSNSFTLVAG